MRSALDRLRAPASIVLAVCLVIFAVFLAIGASWVRADSRPAVRLLGSGSGLSLLVTTPSARLLIATGNDASAFGNALTAARHLTSTRIDILILAGDDGDLPVARAATRDLDARATWVIAGPLAAHLQDLGLNAERVLAAPTRFRLGDALTVSIFPSATADASWQARIAIGQTTIAAGSSDALAAAEPATAMVVADGKMPDLPKSRQPRVIAVADGKGVVAALQALADANDAPIYGVRVTSGDVATIGVTASRITIPRGTRQIRPAPAATPTGAG